jgi:hypothetical protein
MSLRAAACDRLRRSAAALLVTLYALLVTFGTQLVVCQVDQGHRAIEWRGTACCSDLPGHSTAGAVSASEAETVDDDESDCSGCRDEPAADLLTSDKFGSKRNARSTAPDPLPTSAALFAGRLNRRLDAAARRLTAGPTSNALPRATSPSFVVLRC